VGRRGGRHHAVCDRDERSGHAGRVPIWRWISAVAADRARAADQMAARPRLVRRRRARCHVFCVLHRAVQSRISLHHRGAGSGRALALALDDHARRRRAWSGSARSPQSVGVVIAMAGAAVALVSGLADAPTGAWRGDLIMIAATLVMALYNVWSRPFIV